MLTQTQLEQRFNGIGGSDVASILHKNPYKSALLTYCEKVDKKSQNIPNFKQKLGNELEQIVLNEFALNNPHLKVEKLDTIYHKEHKFLFANIDAIATDERGKQTIIEVKTTFSPHIKKQFGKEFSDEIPTTYLLQVHHYMCVLNADETIVLALIDGEIRQYIVKRDLALESKVLPILINFWNHNILKRIPPEPKAYSEIAQYFELKNIEIEKDKEKQADESMLEVIKKYKKLTEEAKKIAEEQDDIKLQIAKYLESADTLTDEKGNKLLSFKEQVALRFDTTAFKKEYPNLLNEFQKQTTSRVLRINTPKDI